MQASAIQVCEMRALRVSAGAARALPCPLSRSRAPLQRAGFRGAVLRAAAQEQAADDVVAQMQDQLRSNAAGAAPGPEGAEQAAVKPGDDDRARFQLHWSVDMWRTFQPSKWLEGIDNDAAPVPERIQAFTNTLANAVSTAGILGSSEAARYWAYHLSRSGFFMLQGLAGLLASRNAVGRGGGGDSPAVNRFEAVFRRGWVGPVTEALLMFYQDHELVKEGKYALPWDMTTSGHRQFNPLFMLQRGISFVSEATDTLRRRDAGQADPVWLKSGLLPDYYTSGFHYQTDGWLSASSAKVYESSTETLFVGRQDAMQRCTLVPLRDFMAGRDASQLQALEVAAGTGRFATYVKDNYPSLNLTVSDLSPFYLAEARNNIKYWKRMRAPDAQFGGIDGSGCAFLQTAAEKLDVPDNSQDIVYCVYLFHELPPEVRRAAAAEMARVLKPGGICILTDSSQLGDREAFDATLANFGDFQEPHYRNYIATPLGPMFEEAGLKCGMKVVGSSTKSLSFFKPLEDPKPQQEAKPQEAVKPQENFKPQEDDMFAVGGSAQAAAVSAAAGVAAEAQEDE